MTDGRKLQVGGALKPQRDIYIERPEDQIFLTLLQSSEYVNVLSPRQMGKSSLMVLTISKLQRTGVRTANVDIAADLAGTLEPEKWFLGLIREIARKLGLDFDVSTWWRTHLDDALGQRFQRFFREVVCEEIPAPTRIVVFLDEIDNTLSYSFTDSLFTAIRGMYNERSLDPRYERISFCLIGVATPNELIKDRRSTSYNVGRTLALRDFDAARDDLGSLARALSDDANVGKALIERVLYWTGGQPLLTIKFCGALLEARANTVATVDAYVHENFRNLSELRTDIHFQQVLRFVEMRFSSAAASLRLYAKVLRGKMVKAETTLPHLQLELSGLVKRGDDGNLINRNRLYSQLFGEGWLKTTNAIRSVTRYQRAASIAAFVALISLGGWGYSAYRAYVEESQITGSIENLSKLGVDVSGTKELGYKISRAPATLSKRGKSEAEDEQAWQEIHKFPLKRRVVDLKITTESGFSDLSDLAEFANLERLALWTFEMSKPNNVEFLTQLKKLKELILAVPISDFLPLSGLTHLETLWLFHFTDPPDFAPLANLVNVEELRIFGRISDLNFITKLRKLKTFSTLGVSAKEFSMLRSMTSLEDLDLRNSPISDLDPLSGLTHLRRLNLSGTKISDVRPLSRLTNLSYLDLSETNVDITQLVVFSTLATLKLRNTGVSDIRPLLALSRLEDLDLSECNISDLGPLSALSSLRALKLRSTNTLDFAKICDIPSLTTLDLSRSPIPDLEWTRKCEGLQDLDLSDTDITSLRPLRGLLNLRNLALANTKITEDEIAALKEGLAPPRGSLRTIGKGSLIELRREAN